MKIVFAARSDLLTRRGGDTVQILKTKSAIENICGSEIILCMDVDELAKMSSVDIVHVFNLQTTEVTLAFIQTARRIGAKVALSTIYWNLWHAAVVDTVRSRQSDRYLGPIPHFEALWRIIFQGKSFKKGFLGRDYVLNKREIVDCSDILLPNSDEELVTVANDIGVPMSALVSKSVVIPNAVDLAGSGETSHGRTEDANGGIRHSVAIVGRIEPIKNQLSVINALKGRPHIPLLIIGRRSNDPKHARYCDDVVEAGKRRGNVRFIDEIPHSEVMSLLKGVKVHVLASFRESPGLATLEALHAGCNIVTAEASYCPIAYYSFDKIGSQCNPFSVSSIERAIFFELDAPAPVIPEDYFSKFSYQNVARHTYNAYMQVC